MGSLAPGLVRMTVVGLTLALATACGDGGTTTRAGTPVSSSSGTPAMASADPTPSEPLTVSVGDSAGPLRAALGAPSAERQLTNAAPNTMGAELIESRSLTRPRNWSPPTAAPHRHATSSLYSTSRAECCAYWRTRMHLAPLANGSNWVRLDHCQWQ